MASLIRVDTRWVGNVRSAIDTRRSGIMYMKIRTGLDARWAGMVVNFRLNDLCNCSGRSRIDTRRSGMLIQIRINHLWNNSRIVNTRRSGMHLRLKHFGIGINTRWSGLSLRLEQSGFWHNVIRMQTNTRRTGMMIIVPGENRLLNVTFEHTVQFLLQFGCRGQSFGLDVFG